MITLTKFEDDPIKTVGGDFQYETLKMAKTAQKSYRKFKIMYFLLGFGFRTRRLF